MPNLVEYGGPVYHIFFHPLIYRPELAFDGSASAQGMDDYMATVKEFKSIISSLYQNGYMLADLEEFYGYETDENGELKYVRKYIPFPEGKKPLIISEDDVNYYKYMKEGGCVYKLVLDENGNVRDYTIDENGKETISDDRDMVTILDKFVAEHPDFSFNGAKGLLAPTGFDGTLGYQTQYDSPNRQSEIAECKRVIARLKETGWKFASHSYAHAHMSKMTAEEVRSDVRQWMDEVGSLVGETTVWIYPYGEAVTNGTEAHRAMENAGFRIFCGVGPKPYEQIRGETVFQDRMNVDGISLRRPDDSYFSDMFINSQVIDLEGRSGKPAQ